MRGIVEDAGTRNGWRRDGLLVLGALLIGWWAHGDRPVQAATGDIQFQMHSLNASPDSLLIYSGQERTIYVYKGATTGNAELQCSYKFVVSSAGQPVHREPCNMGPLIR